MTKNIKAKNSISQNNRIKKFEKSNNKSKNPNNQKIKAREVQKLKKLNQKIGGKNNNVKSKILRNKKIK